MARTFQDSEKEDIIKEYMDTCFIDIGFAYMEALKSKESIQTFNLDLIMYPSVMRVLADSVSRFQEDKNPKQSAEALSCLICDLIHSGIRSRGKTAAIRTLGKLKGKEGKED